jgi:glycine/D-amino acid oxidase-like deaminating enzyme
LIPEIHADIVVPVLIVGGGGCGLASSLFLSRQGIRSLLIERHPPPAGCRRRAT